MLILDTPIDEATSDMIFGAGLDDASIMAFDGHPALNVDREARTLLDAIASAVTQVLHRSLPPSNSAYRQTIAFGSA
jgi:hypothetical protein